jgi:hypothetical protein
VAEQHLINTCCPSVAGSPLQFSFGVFSSFVDLPKKPNTVFPQVDNPDDFNKGYTRLAELSFGAWRFATESRSLDANLSENRRSLSSGYQPLVWQTNQYVVCRWFADYSTELVPQQLAVTTPSFLAARFAFAKAERVSTGQAHLTLCGLPGDVYAVERSCSLHQWDPVGVVTNTAAGFVDLADATADENHMFYRARLR